MAYPVDAGAPTHSGTYTPEKWAAKTIRKFYAQTFLTKITNTDYEGEITSFGDKVHMRVIPDITVSDYIIGAGLAYENPAPSDLELLIDKGKSYSFNANLVQVKQDDISFINKFTEDAADQMKVAIERAFLADVYTGAHADNKGAAAGAISGNIDLGTANAAEKPTKADILEFVANIKQVLSENECPPDGRYIVLSASFVNLLEKSDLKNASFSGDGKSMAKTGFMGNLSGMDVYESNLLSIVTDPTDGATTNVIAGHPYAITFATQLTENEHLKNPWDFGDLYRGLQVYGYKVIKPELLAWFYAQPA